ncbi:dihydropteroate synthase [Clostridium sporogenes]|uniref:dihydropteroate synthase n=2 Tax=Clostridium TaxID=1485 RepID=UPI000A42FBD3|nr:dihydropteroate synthase [Clostridium sporogenes]MCW6061819.1 dihydropteroate synthase [Clostridium sporogenes]MCW6068555.1 dihydropteroate synthase [Clostridium sporogenes]MDS1008314.1 dihydropteroate synthase [Clostridium sporogenes]UBI12256.1 dihydropteroate synthase [Clostridium sporogenes]
MIIELNKNSFPEELSKIEVHEGSINIFMNKNSITPLKIFNVLAPAANIIKQELMALGGDCAINKYCVNCKVETSDIILLGTDRQYKKLLAKLKYMTFFRIQEIAVELENYIKNNGAVRTILKDGREINYENLKVMGIINCTPDSFYEGSRKNSIEEALKTAEKMLKEGAEILDIGGESTRPGSDPVDEEEEIKRVVPVIKEIKNKFKDAIISIDTYRANTAKAAIEAGADIVNDISAMKYDENMVKVVKEYNVPVILMHVKGKPKDMQIDPVYKDLMKEIHLYFSERIDYCRIHGITENKIILDPGIGFGKTVEHNLKIMNRIEELKSFNLPVLLAASRKATIGKVLGNLPTEERLEGTIALSCLAVDAGLQMVRVHDVKENIRAIRMLEAVRKI